MKAGTDAVAVTGMNLIGVRGGKKCSWLVAVRQLTSGGLTAGMGRLRLPFHEHEKAYGERPRVSRKNTRKNI
jgi:hypothetical protein